MTVQILTHRGLEPSKPDFFPESSIEAFADQLKRGFGLEFDLNFVKDGIIINHDSNLKRITEGKDTRNFSDITLSEATNFQIPSLDEVMTLIEKSSSKIHALHLKGIFQTQEYVERLSKALLVYEHLWDKLLIFDVKPETAAYLKQNGIKTHYAPSVAHPYDIKRYNESVHGTLFSVSDAVKYKQKVIYDWVWLDEWDRADENDEDKTLYNKDVFQRLKNAGYKIALVTPELHGTSPALLGRESHPDAKNKETLFARIEEIIALQPDAICTDYPEDVLVIHSVHV